MNAAEHFQLPLQPGTSTAPGRGTARAWRGGRTGFNSCRPLILPTLKAPSPGFSLPTEMKWCANSVFSPWV